MSLSFFFTPSGFTPSGYDEVIEKLEEAGAGNPPGRLFHAALEADGKIQVFDIWDSKESFEAFGPTLLPIMASVGADPGQPMVSAVRNTIEAPMKIHA